MCQRRPGGLCSADRSPDGDVSQPSKKLNLENLNVVCPVFTDCDLELPQFPPSDW